MDPEESRQSRQTKLQAAFDALHDRIETATTKEEITQLADEMRVLTAELIDLLKDSTQFGLR